MKRALLTLLGLGFVGLGGLGVVLPGLPTTPFLILAAACFAKSSPRLHGWLMNNRLFGPILRNWEESRSIPRRAKIISLITILLVGTSSVIMLKNLYLKILIPVILIFPVIFISRLKETESLQSSETEP